MPIYNSRSALFSYLRSLPIAALLAAGMAIPAVSQTPAPGLSNPQLGTNLSAVVDYTREWPFADSMKVARTWISQQQGMPWGMGAPLTLTSDGWPAALLPGQYAETLIYDNNTGSPASYPTGQYTVLYDGSGTIQFDVNSGSIVSQTPGRMVINVPSAAYGIYLMITATNPVNPVRNIRLLAPGTESAYQTNPFHPVFLDKLKGYKVLRFMEWMQTNTTNISKWQDRPVMSDYTYTRRGVPLEIMIKLANITGASPWFNIPHMADDDYVKQFAQMVKTQLDPSIPFYIEYSNETWNTQFQQTQYVRTLGLTLGATTDPTIAGTLYTSVRGVQIFNIFTSVLGNTNRIRRVMASQAANPWLQEVALWYQNAYNNIDALAIAPYFSDCSNAPVGGPGVLGDPATASQVDTMSVQQVLDIEKQHIQVCVVATLNAAATVAKRYGVKLVAYEGGQSLQGTGSAAGDAKMATLFGQANRDPGMGSLYDLYLNDWKAAGGDLFMHFTDVTPYNIYGNFGSMERQDQDPATSPKYQALMRYAANHN